MRITATHIWTAAMAAVLTIFSLKFLHVFKFIKWSPIGWTERFHLFVDSPAWVKWLLLGIMCFILFFLLYMITLFTYKIPPVISALVITVIAVFAIEWTIYVKPDMTMAQFIKKISIPFACLLAMIIRFVIGTSVYIRKTFG